MTGKVRENGAFPFDDHLWPKPYAHGSSGQWDETPDGDSDLKEQSLSAGMHVFSPDA